MLDSTARWERACSNEEGYVETLRKLGEAQVVVITIDALNTFRGLNDSLLVEKASKIGEGKKYLAYTRRTRVSNWKSVDVGTLEVVLLCEGLPKEKRSEGVWSSFCIPVHPTRDHPQRRAALTTTFPLEIPDVYLYTYTTTGFRVGNVQVIEKPMLIRERGAVDSAILIDRICTQNGKRCYEATTKRYGGYDSDQENDYLTTPNHHKVEPIDWEKEINVILQHCLLLPTEFWEKYPDRLGVLEILRDEYNPADAGEIRAFSPVVDVTQDIDPDEEYGAMEELMEELERLHSLAHESDLRWLEELRDVFEIPKRRKDGDNDDDDEQEQEVANNIPVDEVADEQGSAPPELEQTDKFESWRKNVAIDLDSRAQSEALDSLTARPNVIDTASSPIITTFSSGSHPSMAEKATSPVTAVFPSLGTAKQECSTQFMKPTDIPILPHDGTTGAPPSNIAEKQDLTHSNTTSLTPVVLAKPEKSKPSSKSKRLAIALFKLLSKISGIRIEFPDYK